MSKITKKPKFRIGTCRSGNPFDVSDGLSEEEINANFLQFEMNDRIDIFCMCEAAIIANLDSINEFEEKNLIYELSKHLWMPEVFSELQPYLEALGLNTSPDFVRFGQSMLLV